VLGIRSFERGRRDKRILVQREKVLSTDYPDIMLWELLGKRWEVFSDRSPGKFYPQIYPLSSFGFCWVSRVQPNLRK